jgi:uncharacterized protein (TIGR02722 family)
MKKSHLTLIMVFSLLLSSCGGFQAKRVDSEEGDELALEITDKWVDKDTENVVKEILKQTSTHKGFKRYRMNYGGKAPKLFIAEVQNDTSEPYFPIEDLNDELLYQYSSSGDFTLIDASSREKLLKEIQYQNDGMVNPTEAKEIGKQSGADLMIFGAVRMRPQKRKGKTIKQYSINIRMTDIQKGVEVLRTRAKVQKYSEQSSVGW